MQVARHIEMLKQPGILKHIANPALMGGQEVLAILPGITIKHHPPRGGGFQPGDHPQQG